MSDEGYKDRIPEAALKNGKVFRPLAYALVTNERAAILEELARQEGDRDYLSSFHGLLESARGDAGELFWFTPDGWWTSMVLCYADQDIPMAGAAGDILRAFGEPCYVTVSGRLNGDDGFDYEENGLRLLIAPD
ncbi:MAG: hypothetical protein LBR87_04900 [Synergistaceae bacterium]|jgi:hypothetical protein|nr:hypothetical protein [Synergistaceae bacterium]